MKTLKIYAISRGYRGCMVWEGSRMTGARLAQHECIPDKPLSHADRHKAIAEWLYKNFNIPGPV